MSFKQVDSINSKRQPSSLNGLLHVNPMKIEQLIMFETSRVAADVT